MTDTTTGSKAEAESPTQRVLGSIDPDAADMLRGYLALPLVSPDLLAEQVRQYLRQLEALADGGEVLDFELATDLASWSERLLDEIDDDMPDENARLVQAAVRYFVNSEDADGDTDSLIGLDDDGEVLEAVAVAIDRAHLLEPPD